MQIPFRFQSTRSAWSATGERLPVGGRPSFQSTRSAWSATLVMITNVDEIGISIHALRMERDARER